MVSEFWGREGSPFRNIRGGGRPAVAENLDRYLGPQPNSDQKLGAEGTDFPWAAIRQGLEWGFPVYPVRERGQTEGGPFRR